MEQLREGMPCPAFELPDATGATVSLDDLKGSPFVLYFYPKDDTSGCTREAQDFTALADDYAAAGTKVVGVSRDHAKSHDKFIAKYDLKVPLAVDEGPLSEAFGTWVEKSMYGRKYMGIDRATFLVDAEGRVARVWRKVKVPGHADEVLAAAEAVVQR